MSNEQHSDNNNMCRCWMFNSEKKLWNIFPQFSSTSLWWFLNLIKNSDCATMFIRKFVETESGVCFLYAIRILSEWLSYRNFSIVWESMRKYEKIWKIRWNKYLKFLNIFSILFYLYAIINMAIKILNGKFYFHTFKKKTRFFYQCLCLKYTHL